MSTLLVWFRTSEVLGSIPVQFRILGFVFLTCCSKSLAICDLGSTFGSIFTLKILISFSDFQILFFHGNSATRLSCHSLESSKKIKNETQFFFMFWVFVLLFHSRASRSQIAKRYRTCLGLFAYVLYYLWSKTYYARAPRSVFFNRKSYYPCRCRPMHGFDCEP